MSTAAAISTPSGAGGISVIRISGSSALKIASEVFRSRVSPEDMASHTCAYGKIVKEGKIIDDGVVTVFRAPNSYTGEDVAEISCHGGIFVTREVLRAILAAGAEPAAPGEFTKRAFLNGKLSLTQAEAVMDVISAGGEQALRAASNAREGRIFKEIKDISVKLVKLTAQLDAWVDYPEEDLPEVQPENLEKTVSDCADSLKKLISGYDRGRILREGLDTVILGKTNVGKSTLMNGLVGYERSIVTDIEGTTRDVIEESVRLGELVLRVSDTAGLRETGDVVESRGISLAKKRAETAQLIIAVFDGSSPCGPQDRELLEFIKGRKAIAVINKDDLEQKLDIEEIRRFCPDIIQISAKNENDFGKFEEIISGMFDFSSDQTGGEIFINERQMICARSSLESLNAALEGIRSGISPDCTAITLENALSPLLDLTGERVSEAVVDEIFSKFCVGK